MIEIWIDGLCEPVNPGGTTTYGVVVKQNKKTIDQKSGVVHRGGKASTNNVAEYRALLEALEWVLKKCPIEETRTIIYSDSQLLVCQMDGTYHVRSRLLAHFWINAKHKVKLLQQRCKMVELRWVPRELNLEADALAKEVYHRVDGRPSTRFRRRRK